MQSHDRQMPIMEHLIELRNRLTWAVLALFITFGRGVRIETTRRG